MHADLLLPTSMMKRAGVTCSRNEQGFCLACLICAALYKFIDVESKYIGLLAMKLLFLICFVDL